MSELAEKVVGIAVGLFVVGAMVPAALVMIANATLTGVDASVKTILVIVLPILAIIAIAMYFFKG